MRTATLSRRDKCILTSFKKEEISNVQHTFPLSTSPLTRYIKKEHGRNWSNTKTLTISICFDDVLFMQKGEMQNNHINENGLYHNLIGKIRRYMQENELL